MRVRLSLLSLLFLATISLGLGQSFKYNTVPKGVKLPVQNIFQIEQDSLGRMWFSTARGVFYSDGIQTFSLPDSIYSNFDFQVSLHIDDEGMVWIYNNSGLPKLFKGGYGDWEEFKLKIPVNGDFSSNIYFQSFGKEDDQLFFLETEFQFFTWDSEGNVKEIDRDPESIGRLRSLMKLSDQVYGFFDQGIFQIESEDMKPIPLEGVELPSLPVMVKKGPDGLFYFLGKNYLAKGSDLNFPEEIIDREFSKDYFFSTEFFGLGFDKGNLFYHFNSPLRKLKLGDNRPLELGLEYILNSFSIQDYFIDREGILWMSTNRGLVNINSLIFQNYGYWSSELLGEEVTAIHRVKEGEYLFGFNNGIQYYSRYSLETLYRDGFPDGIPTGRIINFTQGKENEVWFSANWAGVGLVDTERKEIQLFRPTDEVNISHVEAVGDSLIITGPQDVFISSTADRGSDLFAFNLKEEIRQLLGDSFFYLRKASILSDGRLIIMRASKLDNPIPLVENDRMVIAEGYDFLETNEGLLLGTESGLKIVKDNQVIPFSTTEEKIKRPVFVLKRDSRDHLWAGTDDGIFGIAKDTMVHYNESNGLIANEINRGALTEAENNNLLIGTVRGFSMFFQTENFLAYGRPKVSLAQIKIGDQVLTEQDLSFPSSQNSLEVDFTAVGFNESQPLWIHYRLKGYGEDWQIITDPKSSTLFFGNLASGNYQLELKASYAGNSFSETMESPTFRILKPFYLQAWFLILIAIVLVAIGILINVLFRQFQKVGSLKSAFDRSDKEKGFIEEQFKNVWNSSKDGLALSYDGDTIIAANPAFAHWLKIEPEELSGKKFSDLIFEGKDGDSFYREFENRMNQIDEEGFEMEARIVVPGGKLDVALFNRVIQEDGLEDKKVILTVLRDISTEKAIAAKLREAKEEAEQANRFKTSLLSNVSHEIRTPLNGIIGGAEHIMMTHTENPKLLSQLDIILQSGERLLQTINSLLDMAKIEANKMEVVYTPTSIREFSTRLLESFQALAKKRQLELKADLPGKEQVILIDRRFTEIILNNVLGNAIKYSWNAHVWIQIEVQNQLLKIQVRDQGVGMSQEFLEKVFDPFEQESTGHQRQFEGTGLGLSITRHLVDLLSGKITISSQKGKGTTVIVEIPLPNT